MSAQDERASRETAFATPGSSKAPGPIGARRPTVAIVGGGLAGLAAAATLAARGAAVELFEAKRRLGGRAGSFHDDAAGEWVDHCQHVALGCCDAFLDFARQVGWSDHLRRDRHLTFLDRAGRPRRLGGVGWLPAPLHLAPALFRLGFLSWRERWSLIGALRRLGRLGANDPAGETPFDQWLAARGQSPRAQRCFWGVIVVSALSETLDRVTTAAARQVFVQAFMTRRDGHHLIVPTVPLQHLYDHVLADWLRARGAALRLETPVRRLAGDARGVTELELADGGRRTCDHYVLATPWRVAPRLLDDALRAALPGLPAAAEFAGAPIAGVHLWFDRPVLDRPHAVCLERLTQWVFARPGGHRAAQRDGDSSGPASVGPVSSGPSSSKPDVGADDAGYVQVVISAARALDDRPRDEVLAEVLADLRELFPAARAARLLRWKIVSHPDAVFSPLPGVAARRPGQATAVPNLFLAGDYTRTGWPATMEGAVRSGRLAAEAVLQAWQAKA